MLELSNKQFKSSAIIKISAVLLDGHVSSLPVTGQIMTLLAPQILDFMLKVTWGSAVLFRESEVLQLLLEIALEVEQLIHY